MSPQANEPSRLLVTLTVEELDERIASACARAFALHIAATRPTNIERLTVAEAAELLRCSQRQVRRLIATGRIAVSKLAEGGSSRVLIARSEVERLLRETSR